MAQAMISQTWNVQELFLNCCVPILDEVLTKLYPKTCEGCESGKLSQRSHQCLYQNEYLLDCILEKSYGQLKTKRHQVIQRINTLLRTKSVRYVNGDTVIAFLGADIDPFMQLVYDPELQERLREKMQEYSIKKDWKSLSIQKQPDIVAAVEKLGKSFAE